MTAMTVRRQITLIAVVPLVFFIALLTIAMMLAAETSKNAAVAQHTTDVLAKIEDAYGILIVANRTTQAYIKTHDPNALKQYAAAVASGPAKFDALVAVTRGNAAESAAAASFIRYMRQATPFMNHYVELLEAGKQAEAQKYGTSPPLQQLGRNILASKIGLEQAVSSQSNGVLSAQRRVRERLVRALIAVVTAGIIICVALAASLGARVRRRLRQLTENAELLADHRPTRPIEGNDEFAEVDRATHEMAKSLEDSMALQVALLGQDLPKIPNLRLDSVYVPAARQSEVGGDWFDMFEIDRDVVGVSIGDVAGHGLRAAATMTALREAIRVATRREHRPSAALTLVNRSLCIDEPGVLATAIVATFNTRTGVFQWSSAGHPAPIVLRPDSGLSVADGKGLVLGVHSHVMYDEFTVQLDEGCAIVLFTDGLIEAERHYFKGLRELQAAVIAAYDEPATVNPAEAIARRIFSQKQPRDDAALLFIGVTAIGRASFEHKAVWHLDARDAKAAHRVKRAILWRLAGVTTDIEEFHALELVYGQLLANVARHTPGPATVTFESLAESAVLTVEDHGPQFEAPFGRPVDVMAEGGRGYWLISQFSESVEIDRTDDGNRVTVRVPLAPLTPATSWDPSIAELV